MAAPGSGGLLTLQSLAKALEARSWGEGCSRDPGRTVCPPGDQLLLAGGGAGGLASDWLPARSLQSSCCPGQGGLHKLVPPWAWSQVCLLLTQGLASGWLLGPLLIPLATQQVTRHSVGTPALLGRAGYEPDKHKLRVLGGGKTGEGHVKKSPQVRGALHLGTNHTFPA